MRAFIKPKFKSAQVEALVMAILACGLKSGIANPAGMTVKHGSATTVQNGNQLTIHTSQNAFIDWRGFNIGKNETTTFVQPGANSVVWNRINDPNPSQIMGNLNANGFVVLMNQNGFYFGKDSVVNVGGFLATTASITQPSSGAGGFWQFSGPPPAASIINYGQIIASPKSAVYLVAEKVENHGTLTAPDGTLGLYAGKELLVCDSPDGRGLSAKVTLPEGSVDNTGKLIADAGTIAIHARTINQDGIIEANSVREKNGVIELVATDAIHLGANSRISAQGGSDGVSNGGKITLKSDRLFDDKSGSQLNVSGGAQGGNGGKVELCADELPSIESNIEGGALPGWIGGQLFLDPKDIIIGNSGTATTQDGKVGQNDGGNGTYRFNVNNAFRGFSQITLDAKQTITIAGQTTWDLVSSTGISDPGSKLTLDAGRIIFQSGSSIIGGQGWSVELNAGWGTAAPADFTLGGWGGIYLNGGPANASGVYPKLNGTIETQDGSIKLHADKEVVVGAGAIRTLNGGEIDITAVAGKVDAGQKVGGLVPTRGGSMVPNASGVGGIGTVNGGDVNITAGTQIISGFVDATQADPYQLVGCYGAGNVTLNAKSVVGRYLVSHGIGTIYAPAIGTAQNPISLALINGSWNLVGADVFLNEVYNPNGTQNFNRNPVSGFKYSYDYSDNAALFINAANSVHLMGNAPMKRSSGAATAPILPPHLTILAGLGGIELGSTMVMYPSPNSSLAILTSGSLYSTPGVGSKLILSDSDSQDYTTFADQHSRVPLQMPSAAFPITVTVGGDIRNLQLQFPKKSLIDVGGDTVNFFFTGQNLLPGDVTQIHVAGDIKNHLDFTSTGITTIPDMTIFDPTLTGRPDLSLNSLLTYDPKAKTLTFNGRMTTEVRDFLLNPVVKKRDVLGNVVTDLLGNPIYETATFVAAGAINALYQDSQNISVLPAKNYGMLIGGPGKLEITARNMNLGATMGVRSTLDALNPNMINLYASTRKGADIDINLTGDLQITSSRIASFNGGAISVTTGGAMDIGSQASYSSDDTPKGIWTGAGGDVKIVANGDVNINGSRIGTFDGGNVWIESAHGKVDAGQGGRTIFGLNCPISYDPAAGKTTYLDPGELMFGSGILSMTRRKSTAVVGNITILAESDVSCKGGGVMQLSGNGLGFQDQWVHVTSMNGDVVATGAGIIGVNPVVEAKTGSIKGLVLGRRDVSIHAQKTVDVNVLSGGKADVSSRSGPVIGFIVANDSVNVTGDSLSVTAFSTSGQTSTQGDTTGSKIGTFAGVVAQGATKTTHDASETVAKQSEAALDETVDSDKKNKGKKLVLAKSTGRVTVILPKN